MGLAMYAPSTALEAGTEHLDHFDCLHLVHHLIISANGYRLNKNYLILAKITRQSLFSVTGLPLWASIVLTGLVGVIYTTFVSSIQSYLWTS